MMVGRFDFRDVETVGFVEVAGAAGE